MARLSDNEITRLKNEVSLSALVESSGIALKKQGKDYLGHCPFHHDKSPSLVISPDKSWQCVVSGMDGTPRAVYSEHVAPEIYFRGFCVVIFSELDILGSRSGRRSESYDDTQPCGSR